MSKLKRDFGTQYNWFLMNRISTKDKSVGCHMSILRVKPCDKVEVSKPIEQIEKETVLVRPAVRSISTQCCITRTSDSVALPASNCKNIKLLQALPKDINQSKQKVFCLLSCVKKFISANTSYEDLTFEVSLIE